MAFNMKRNQLRENIGLFLMIVAVILFISIGGWHAARWINWTYGYSKDTRAAICEMVKPEALVNPSDCE